MHLIQEVPLSSQVMRRVDPPKELGRGVLLLGDAKVPEEWKDAKVIEVHNASVVDELHQAWLTRTAVAIRLFVDPAMFRPPATLTLEPWKLDPKFSFDDDRMHFLLWANNYDARSGQAIWWWSRKAQRLGATASTTADVCIDGMNLWVDGGPRQALDVPTLHRESIDLGRLAVAPLSVRAVPQIALAPDQMQAVSHEVGPARILAPAGSGKTRVLTERLRYLLGPQQVERDTVVAIAYNKRAQEELSTRTKEFRPRVVTLNALGWELLGRPTVLDEREVRRIIERLVPAQRRKSNVDPIAPYIEALSRIRLGLVDPLEAEDERDDVPGLAEAFVPFRQELRKRNAVDFDDQVYAAIENLLRDGEYRRQAQSRFRHLLVDEFQDLTPAHLLLVRLLSCPEFDVYGVGDDDQVIYGHAGADPAFLINFDAYFPGAASHPLSINYRCPSKVVEAARTLLSYNNRRVPKTIEAGPSADPSLRALTIAQHAPDQGAQACVREVLRWLELGVEPKEIAVLTRVNSLLLAPQVALANEGVPLATTLDTRVLDRTGARAALAYLRIATSPEGFARSDVLEVLRRPSRGLPIWIDKWFRAPQLQIKDLRLVALRLDDAKVTAKLDGLTDDLEVLLRAAKKSSTRQLLKLIKDQIGLGQAMGLLDASSAASSHLDDLEALEQVADLHPDPAGFEPWLRQVLQQPTQVGGVTLATVHKVKGQEWPMVALFGVSEGLLPHRLSEDLEEERRILHVGITRGHREVAVLADKSRESSFLRELEGSAPRQKIRAQSKSAVVINSKPNREPSTAHSVELFNALKDWRSKRAKSDKVPPYVVLHDRHLQAIADAAPQTLKALAVVDGMGPRRLELYADELLALCQR